MFGQLFCRLRYHNWSQWTSPAPKEVKDSYGRLMYLAFQERKCKRCNLFEVRRY